MTQLQIENLAAKLARVTLLAQRNFGKVEARLDKIHAQIEQLSLGQQLAVQTIAYRIAEESSRS